MGLICANCQTQVITQLRRNHRKEPLCNACGLYFIVHKKTRPINMRKDLIQQRNRNCKATPIAAITSSEMTNKQQQLKTEGMHAGEGGSVGIPKVEISDSEFTNMTSMTTSNSVGDSGTVEKCVASRPNIPTISVLVPSRDFSTYKSIKCMVMLRNLHSPPSETSLNEKVKVEPDDVQHEK